MAFNFCISELFFGHWPYYFHLFAFRNWIFVTLLEEAKERYHNFLFFVLKRFTSKVAHG